MYTGIIKRLDALKAQIPKSAYCLVELPDGTQTETTICEWYEHRHEWIWKRITQGGSIADVCLVLAAIYDECAEDSMKKGDTAAAARMTAEAAHYYAEYERLARINQRRKGE